MAWKDDGVRGHVVGTMSNGWTLLRLPDGGGRLKLRVLNRSQTEEFGDMLLKAAEARKAFEK